MSHRRRSLLNNRGAVPGVGVPLPDPSEDTPNSPKPATAAVARASLVPPDVRAAAAPSTTKPEADDRAPWESVEVPYDPPDYSEPPDEEPEVPSSSSAWPPPPPMDDDILPPALPDFDDDSVTPGPVRRVDPRLRALGRDHDFLGDGDHPPPTEEVPNAVLEDLASVYGAPMDVPDASSIPGLDDRFTPVGGHRREDYGYTATPIDELADERAVLPPAMLPFHGDEPERTENTTAREGSSGGFIRLIAFAVGAIAIGGIAVMAFFIWPQVQQLRGLDDPPVPEAASPTNLQSAPPNAVPAAPPPVEEAPEEAAVDDLEAEAEAEPAAPKAARGASSAKTGGSPAGAKAPEAVTPDVGTLKIRSNRRVLVKVNGQPKDYSPLDLPMSSGDYVITAALPGRPDTEQTLTVTLEGGVVEPVNFSF